MEVATVSKIKFKNILQKCNNKIDDWRIYIWKISMKCVAIRGGRGEDQFYKLRNNDMIAMIQTAGRTLDTSSW